MSWLAGRADTRCLTFLRPSRGWNETDARDLDCADVLFVLFSAYSVEKARYAGRKAVLASQRQAGMQAGGSFLGRRGFAMRAWEFPDERANPRTYAFSIGSISNLGGQQLLPQHTASARISAIPPAPPANPEAHPGRELVRPSEEASSPLTVTAAGHQAAQQQRSSEQRTLVTEDLGAQGCNLRALLWLPPAVARCRCQVAHSRDTAGDGSRRWHFAGSIQATKQKAKKSHQAQRKETLAGWLATRGDAIRLRVQ